MPVPFIDLKRFEPDFMDRWIQQCREVTANTMFVGGPIVTRLEQRLAQKTGAPHVVGCANGTDAIQLALRALDIGPGDLVLIPDATFWATFEAVVNVGARPVTVDIDWNDLQMDFDLFCEAVEKYKPKAAILVHLYGWCTARLKDFRNFCEQSNVLLIEDGAQCYDVSYHGEPIFADALVATTSFYPAKVLGSCGDAGAVFCRNEQLADKVRLLGNHGRVTHYQHGIVGWNSRMAGFDAAWLNLCLDYIDERLASRRDAAAWYRRELAALGFPVFGAPEGVEDNGYLVVVVVDPAQRPEIEKVLRESGVGFGNVYPSAMSQQPGAEGWIAGQIGGEKADLLGRGVLNPPLFAYITQAELDESLAAFRKAAAVVGLSGALKG